MEPKDQLGTSLFTNNVMLSSNGIIWSRLTEKRTLIIKDN